MSSWNSTTAWCCAIAIRGASAQCCGRQDRRAPHPLLAKLGVEPLDQPVQRRLPLPGHPPPPGRDQARAHGQPPGRRHGQHLRQRVAVPRRHPPRAAPPTASRGPRSRDWSTPCAKPCCAPSPKGGSTLRDYVDSRGEPGRFQLDYYVYGRRRPALPRLRHADPRRAAGRAGELLLPAAASARPRAPAGPLGPCFGAIYARVP